MKMINHEIFGYVHKLNKKGNYYHKLQRTIVEYPADTLEILEKILKGLKLKQAIVIIILI